MIKSWFDVRTTQFILFLSAGDLFESAFSLWVSLSHSQKIINLSLLAACVASCPYCSGFWSEKSDRSKCNKEFDFEKSIVSIVEICLHETVNNQTQTMNTRIWNYGIKYYDYSNEENTVHWALE